MKKIRKISACILSGIMIFSFAFGFRSFSSENRVMAAQKEIQLNKTSVSIGIGEQFQLKSNVPVVHWASENKKTVSITDKGLIKGLKTGTAKVGAVASRGGAAECDVTVKKSPSSVSISKSTLVLGVGEKYTLTSSVPKDTASASRKFRSSNSSAVIMTRSEGQGEILAIKPGISFVTVTTFNGKTATCAVSVKNAPQKVGITPKKVVLHVGETCEFDAVLDEDSASAERTFRSNNDVVRMTKTNGRGKCIAVKEGKARVTVCTYNKKAASCIVTVVK